jgi:hypothetical protein
MKYISNYIGTVSKSDYETVRELITPILKKHFIGLRGRGRGSRKAGERFSVSFFRPYKYNPYHQSIPLEESSLVGLYLRVEPTKQFIKQHKPYYSQSDIGTVWSFIEMACPFIRKEILAVIEQNNIKVIRKPEI